MANRKAMAVSERSPPDSSDRRLTRFGPGFDLDAGPQQVRRVLQYQTALSAGEQRGEQRRELARDVTDSLVEQLGHLPIDLPDDLLQIPAGRLHVVQFAVQELVPLAKG